MERKIIVVDERPQFLDDIYSRLMFYDELPFKVVTTISDLSDLNSAIKRFEPTDIVVAGNMIDAEDYNFANIKLYAYASNNKELLAITQKGVQSYGIVETSKELIQALERNVPISVEPAKDIPSTNNSYNSRPNDSKFAKSDDNLTMSLNPSDYHSQDLNRRDDDRTHDKKQKNAYDNRDNRRNDNNDRGYEQNRTANREENRNTREEKPYEEKTYNEKPYEEKLIRPDDDCNRDDRGDNYNRDRYNDNYNRDDRDDRYNRERRNAISDIKREYDDEDVDVDFYDDKKYDEPRNSNVCYEERRRSENGGLRRMKNTEERTEERKPRRAKVVTVYAAKGGVGKTTISTSVATYLALTSNGRRHYRTCLIDYNIDFGDVLTTLNLDEEGPNMSLWAEDIRDRLRNGESTDEITYSRSEIESYLQFVEETELFVLTAPLTHEDSLEIGSDEIDVMLNNIISYAGFDFVVCDTGNNTRDSSVSALLSADNILLIANQTVMSANCNDSFLSAAESMHLFGYEKISLIINSVLPKKETGLSVEDIKETFDEFPCIAEIPKDSAVIKAGNSGVPLVFNTEHEFTKQIGKIVAYVTGNNRSEPEIKKKGFLGKIFKK